MRKTACSIVCLSALLIVGCSSGSRNVTISSWQKNVEQYVSKEGKGDPTVLRDTTLADSRRGFSMIGSNLPQESTDANGVLLGHRSVGGRTWFIYLVGLVKEQQVEEIRAAAFRAEGGKYQWKLGDDDRAALKQYVAYNDQLWKQRFPNRGAAPEEYLGFPLPQDNFTLSIADEMVTIVHPASGARWELAVPAGNR